MELDNYDTRSASGCSKPLKACAVIAALVVLAIIGMLIYAMRMPTIQVMLRCRDNMTQIGDALERYHSVNNSYPPDLRSIEKEYLKDTSVLHCPADKSSDGELSYIYHRPPSNAKDTFVILECDRHKAGRDLPPSKLKLMINGQFKSPSFREAMDDASEHKK